ncbi:SGNH/GDSL hydrolase family protein [Massilia sp. YIM B04103]|uniref:SGNH/GDSL hydrolase family protein n=1 Tax=Massilia sp. YIM B04103 TaxID=2963106 RepID=UPI00210C9311|nr:SGNH/GDSL hydrolase family protein [Massilia sp. YIM B04103]
MLDYAQAKAAIEKDKEQRIQEHQTRIANRQRMRTMAGPAALAAPQPLNLIAQGDSWFDYPLPFPGASDVIAHLRNVPKGPEILSLAHHGEAAESMLGVKKLHELLRELRDPQNGHFDAILFSGGGNDLAGDQFRLWVRDAVSAGSDPAQGLLQPRVDGVLAVVRAAYEDLAQARDRIDASIPIFVHSYDFALPDGKGVCGAGPWLQPGLLDRGWEALADGQVIVRELLSQFSALLDELQTRHANFIHVKTQGTLGAHDWANELHPTPGGFARITQKFLEALRAWPAFQGRI